MLHVSADVAMCLGTAPPGVDSIAESGGGGSERETVSGPSVCALDLKLQQLSVYASQRRLCIAAAVANACQEVEEGLLMLARPKAKSIAADIAPALKVYLPQMIFACINQFTKPVTAVCMPSPVITRFGWQQANLLCHG